MPRFLTLSPIYCEPRGVSGGKRMVQPGTEIGYDGGASFSLFPLNAAARQVEADLLSRKNPDKKRLFNIWRQRAFRGLPRHLRTRCERAAAEAVNDGPVAATPPTKRRGARTTVAGHQTGSMLLKR